MTPYEIWRSEFAKAIDPIYGGVEYLDYLVLHTGCAKLWPGVRAAIITRFQYYPGATIIEGLVAAGDLNEIRQILIPAAEAWGKQQGASHAVIASRPGWQKALAADGYELHQVMLAKEL